LRLGDLPAQERGQQAAQLEQQGALEGAPAVAGAPLRAQRGAQVGVRDAVRRAVRDRLAKARLGLGVPALLEVGGAEVVVHLGQAVVEAQRAAKGADRPVELAFVDQLVALPVPLDGRGRHRSRKKEKFLRTEKFLTRIL
jgi:hypothetical protein